MTAPDASDDNEAAIRAVVGARLAEACEAFLTHEKELGGDVAVVVVDGLVNAVSRAEMLDVARRSAGDKHADRIVQRLVVPASGPFPATRAFWLVLFDKGFFGCAEVGVVDDKRMIMDLMKPAAKA